MQSGKADHRHHIALNVVTGLFKKSETMQLTRRKMALAFLPFLLLTWFSLSLGVRQSAAQDEGDPWLPPVNVSQSGTATNSFMVQDDTGTVHLFWQDAFDGFVYATFADGTWSQSRRVRLPFTTPPFATPASPSFVAAATPHLVAGEDGNLHGFWIDAEGRLQYSRAAIEQLAEPEGWTSPVTLAEQAAEVSAAADAAGRLHLSFLRTAGSDSAPAGIYYRQSTDGGSSWGDIGALYTSNYLRALESGQGGVQVATSGTDDVYVVWDNPLLEQVFLSRSIDGGETWPDTAVIAQREPEDAANAAGPSQIRIHVHEGSVHLTWHAGEDDESCRQYHQWSSDGGINWEEPQVIFENETACASTAQFLTGLEDDLLFLFSAVADGYYLQAWRDGQWSEPELQSALATLTDTNTFRPVRLACLQSAVTPENELLVAGCGAGEIEDIWVQQRPLGELESWLPLFPQLSPWQVDIPVEEGDFHTRPLLLTDQNNNFHAVWVGSNPTLPASSQATHSIYYAAWEDGQWSRPASIFTTDTTHIAAAIDGRDLLLVWHDTRTGELLFSRAQLEVARFPADWAQPMAVTAPNPTIGSPSLLIRANGDLHVAYLVRLNEGRGGYLVRSADGGRTWGEPTAIFDAVTLSWPMVERLQVANSGDDTVHAVWAHGAQLAGSGGRVLHYARSQDNGRSWSPPQEIAAGNVAWSQIVALPDGTVFRFWLEQQTNLASIWYQQSYDAGVTWERPIVVTSINTTAASVDLTVSSAGQLHLLLATGAVESKTEVQNWLWEGTRWTMQNSLFLPLNADLAAGNWTVTMNDAANLGVLYPVLVDEDGAAPAAHINFALQQVGEGEAASVATPVVVQNDPQATETPAPPTITPPATSADDAAPPPPADSVTATPTAVSFDLDTDSAPSGAQLSSTQQLLVGVMPATLLLIVIVAGVFMVRFRKRK